MTQQTKSVDQQAKLNVILKFNALSKLSMRINHSQPVFSSTFLTIILKMIILNP